VEDRRADDEMTTWPIPEWPNSDALPAQNSPRRSKWKPVLGALVAALVVWQLAHVVTTNGGGKTDASVAQGTHSAASTSAARPVHVTLGGHRVLGAGQPIILLNPGLVAPGGQVSVQGSGFDPNATVDVTLSTGGSSKGTAVALATTSKTGSLSTQFNAPQSMNGTGATVVARERGSDKSATGQLVSPGGVASVSIEGKSAGQPGDHVTISATGFDPGETVDVYWGRLSGTPAATLTADSSGGLSHVSVPVGLAPVGATTLALMGVRTHATATVPYQMLGLYPSTTPHPYALQAGKLMTYSGSGFAPNEQVLVYLNSSGGTPALAVQASSNGRFETSFTVPFGLTGRQTLTAIGAQSRAAVSTAFTVLAYGPSVQASTYGALPGTSLSFYAKGFAANEVVLVYVGRGSGSDGQLVTAFRVDGNGNAAAAGSYVLPSNGGPTLNFTLVGQRSGGSGVAKVSVMTPAQPVTVPTQPPYVLPPSLGGKATQAPSPTQSGTHR
jgi:hypothetical protein